MIFIVLIIEVFLHIWILFQQAIVLRRSAESNLQPRYHRVKIILFLLTSAVEDK